MATEIKMRAERRCGELLRGNLATPAERGERGANVRWGSKSNETTSQAPPLADMGLTKDESGRYQQLAAMPDRPASLKQFRASSDLTLRPLDDGFEHSMRRLHHFNASRGNSRCA